MAERKFTTRKAVKAKHGRGKVVLSPHPEDQELKNTLTVMLNSLRVTCFLLFQKLKSDSLTIEGQREFAETLGFEMTDKGEIIFDESLDPGDHEYMALLRGRLRQWLQAHEERALLRGDQLH